MNAISTFNFLGSSFQSFFAGNSRRIRLRFLSSRDCLSECIAIDFLPCAASIVIITMVVVVVVVFLAPVAVNVVVVVSLIFLDFLLFSFHRSWWCYFCYYYTLQLASLLSFRLLCTIQSDANLNELNSKTFSL